jgi:hypothetical protein
MDMFTDMDKGPKGNSLGQYETALPQSRLVSENISSIWQLPMKFCVFCKMLRVLSGPSNFLFLNFYH